MPRRIIHTGLPFEVVNMTFPPQGPGEQPMDGKIIRFIHDDGTLLDFPMAQPDWDELVRQGNAGDDPKRKIEVVKAMPDVLQRRPHSGPRGAA